MWKGRTARKSSNSHRYRSIVAYGPLPVREPKIPCALSASPTWRNLGVPLAVGSENRPADCTGCDQDALQYSRRTSLCPRPRRPDCSHPTGMATTSGNERRSGAVDAAETRVGTVVAPYLKALRRSSVQLFAVYSSVGARFSGRPDKRGPIGPHVRPRHRGPVSSEPYLRRLRGMMVISGMSQSTVELLGAHGAAALIPRGRNGPTPFGSR
jgi:hypothetical protein